MIGRPATLGDVIRDAMYQVPGTSADHRAEAKRTPVSARPFRQTALLCRRDELRLPVISNLHEAARLAVTTLAAAGGLRFTNRAGAHVAVVDYALGLKLVNQTEWAQLDERRTSSNQPTPSSISSAN